METKINLDTYRKILTHRGEYLKKHGLKSNEFLAKTEPCDYTRQVKIVNSGKKSVEELFKINKEIREKTGRKGEKKYELNNLDMGDWNIFRQFCRGSDNDIKVLGRNEFYGLFCDYVDEYLDEANDILLFRDRVRDFGREKLSVIRGLDGLTVNNLDVKKALIEAMVEFGEFQEGVFLDEKRRILDLGKEIGAGYKLLLNEVKEDKAGRGIDNIKEVRKVVYDLVDGSNPVFDQGRMVAIEAVRSGVKKILSLRNSCFCGINLYRKLRLQLLARYDEFEGIYKSEMTEVAGVLLEQNIIAEGAEVLIQV